MGVGAVRNFWACQAHYTLDFLIGTVLSKKCYGSFYCIPIDGGAEQHYQALFLCNICVVFRPVFTFRDLLFIHASTNATDDHKYSPLPSEDFDSSEVLVSFSAFIFS